MNATIQDQLDLADSNVSSLAELELQAQAVSRLLFNHDESDIARKQNAKAKFLERKKHLETKKKVPPTIRSLLLFPLRASMTM
jgi:hypothetical protein